MKTCFVIVASTFALACGTGHPKFIVADRAVISIQPSDGFVTWLTIDGKVRTLESHGGNPQTLVTDAFSAEQITLDSLNLYWVEANWRTLEPVW